MRTLFIDNVDSFTYNVVDLLASEGAVLEVVLNDDPSLATALLDSYDALVVGPGPGRPADATRMMTVLRAAIERDMPVLGICLGLQAIGEVAGAMVGHAPQPMHGKTSEIWHDATGLFAGLPNPFLATRYHSLCLKPGTIPEALSVTARSSDGVIQGVAHRAGPVFGVQFHPESILSRYGPALARNFMVACRR